MSRIPYPDLDADEPTRATAEAIGLARDGDVPNLYRMLLHAPSLAATWLELGSHLRYRGALDDRTRELMICRVANRTGSAYELHHHVPLARRAGVTDQQLAALANGAPGEPFADRDRTLLAYADAALGGSVDSGLARDARQWLDNAGLVELTALVAYYLAVSRFLRALDVDIEG